MLHVLSQQFRDVLDLDAKVFLFDAAADLHDAAGAVHDHAAGTRGLDVIQFLAQKLGRDFRELRGIGAAETAADLFLIAGSIVGRIRDEFAGRLVHSEAAAEVAGRVIRGLLTGVMEVFRSKAQHVVHERAEVRHLVSERFRAGGQGIILQNIRIVVLD